MITCKAQEAFRKWAIHSYKEPIWVIPVGWENEEVYVESLFDEENNLNDVEIKLKRSLVMDWLDSVNIHLYTYAHYHKDEFKHFAFAINGLDRTGEFKTRKEAFEAGVEMAVEMFNNR